MAVNNFEVINYLSEARSRYTEQFRYDPVSNEGAKIFDKYVQVLLGGKIELQEVFRQLMQERSLDTAVGVNLDNIGEIVGQPRTLLSVDIFEFFGFAGVPNAGSFGDFYDPSVGAVFYDANNPRFGNITLTDEVYRIFIKAKIAKNSTHATPEQVMEFANFIFSTSGSTIQNEGSAAYTLLVGKELTSFERSLLTYIQKTDSYNAYLLPQPLGVRVNYGNFDYDSFFGFQGVPNAKGFGNYTFLLADGSQVADGTQLAGPSLQEGVGGKFASFIGVTYG
jgi:hypothetical protein